VAAFPTVYQVIVDVLAVATATERLTAGLGAASGGIRAVRAAEGRGQVRARPVAAYLLAYEATVLAAATENWVRIGVDAKIRPPQSADMVISARARAFAADALPELWACVCTLAAIVKDCAGVKARSRAKGRTKRTRAGCIRPVRCLAHLTARAIASLQQPSPGRQLALPPTLQQAFEGNAQEMQQLGLGGKL
jgi:hypothetical protein